MPLNRYATLINSLNNNYSLLKQSMILIRLSYLEFYDKYVPLEILLY